MLKIYTGNYYKALCNLNDITYMFPENGKSPWDQFEWFDNHLEEFKTNDVSIVTFSPYILNYLNLLITNNSIDFEQLEVKEYSITDNEEIICNDLKAINSDKNIKLIDTRILSDPITWIYEEYNKIKYNK